MVPNHSNPKRNTSLSWRDYAVTGSSSSSWSIMTPKKKSIIKTWIMIELIIATLVGMHLGVEGLAREFCNYIPSDRCDEVDWTDD